MSAKVEVEEIIPCNVFFFFFLYLPNSVDTLKALNVYICCFVGRGATVQYI